MAGADFGFQLVLRGAEEAFDQAAGRRVPDAAVQQPDVQRTAGPLQGVGVWIGLAVGLIVVAALLLTRWRMRARLGLLPSIAAG